MDSLIPLLDHMQGKRMLIVALEWRDFETVLSQCHTLNCKM